MLVTEISNCISICQNIYILKIIYAYVMYDIFIYVIKIRYVYIVSENFYIFPTCLNFNIFKYNSGCFLKSFLVFYLHTYS